MNAVIDKTAKTRIREAIAANTVRLRHERGISQEDLAHRIGISRITLSRLENGHHIPSAEVLYALADALDVTTDSLRQIPASGA